MHVQDPAAPYAAANLDTPFWDLFAAARVMAGVFTLPAHRLDRLLDLIEAQPQHVECMTVRQLLLLVHEAQA